MKALTVKQPWAFAIVTGAKPVENRSIRTHHRGPLAIHAGKTWSTRGARSELCRTAAAADKSPDGIYDPPLKGTWEFPRPPGAVAPWELQPDDNGPGQQPRHPRFPFGAILGVVTVVDSHYATPGCCDSPWAETTYENADGSVATRVAHHVLTDPVRLEEPIVGVRGYQGIFTIDGDLEQAITAAVTVAQMNQGMGT